MSTKKERDAILRELLASNPRYNARQLSEASGIPTRTCFRWLQRELEERQAVEHDIPQNQILKGLSTLRDADGNVKLQWIKTNAKAEEQHEQLRMIAEELADEVRGQYRPAKAPEYTVNDLLVTYPVVDAHTGMFSWGPETGDDYDATITEKILVSGMTDLVDQAPAAKTALIANLADFFHADSVQNRTMRSGHILDVDTRFPRVIQIGVRIYRKMIELALEKHEKVIVKSGIGNHDDHSILWLHMIMQAYFENEPRVQIELPVSSFGFYEFGNTLIGINHGEVKPQQLGLIMAQDMREAWGRTKYGHWLVGHIHHKSVSEFPGVVVESFRSPAAKDSWTHRSGYRAERDVQSIIYHYLRGEVGRNIINVERYNL